MKHLNLYENRTEDIIVEYEATVNLKFKVYRTPKTKIADQRFSIKVAIDGAEKHERFEWNNAQPLAHWITEDKIQETINQYLSRTSKLHKEINKFNL
jgi:hypothetical protein